MIKKLLIAALLLISQFCFAQFFQWNQKADLGGLARSGAVGFSIGTKGYIGLGYTGGSNYIKDFWEYDPTNNTWTQKADFAGTERASSFCFSIGNKGYIGTGSKGSQNFADFWEWDQATNTWTQKADYGGIGRKSIVGFSIGTKGYAGTGAQDNFWTHQRDFWEWDQATNVWAQKADFGGVARSGAGGFSIGTKGYIGTGYRSDGTSSTDVFKDFWEYDPANNTWTQKANIAGTARKNTVAFSIGTKGYIGTGGWFNSTNTDEFYEWNQATNTWTQKVDFAGTRRSGAVGFSIGTKGYLGTGNQFETPTKTKDFWEFDPNACGENIVTSEFITYIDFSDGSPAEGDMIGEGNTVRFDNNSTLATMHYLTINGVIVDSSETVGNFDYTFNSPGTYFISLISFNNCYSDTAYDTITVVCVGSWVQKASMGGVRQGAAGFVIGNKGYIGTGAATSSVLKDFWEWNQSTNIWTQKANFGGGARAYSSGFSAGNKGYFVGGDSIATGSQHFLRNDLWEYNPASNTWTSKANFYSTRGYGVAFSLAGKGYFGMGNHNVGGADFNDLWMYDPTNNTWTQKADMGNNDGRILPMVFTIGDSAYVGLGMGANTYDLYRYDPVSNTWAGRAAYPHNSIYAHGFGIGNYGYLVEDGDAGQDNVWRFDPATNSWVKLGPVPPGWNREFCVSFTIGNYGYAGTGEAGSFTQYNDLWEYTPCVDIITEVKPIEQTKTRMQVYPNPFKTQATFSLNTEVKNAVLSIYELNGREAKSVNFTGKQVILEREGLQSGVYIYSLSTNEQVIATGKLVIE